jgi:hypothetical protein
MKTTPTVLHNNYPTSSWDIPPCYYLSHHIFKLNFELHSIRTSCIDVQRRYASYLHNNKQPPLDARHITKHHATSTIITLQHAIHMGHYCAKYTAWTQPIPSHPLNNTPVRNDKSRSLLQEAITTRYAIKSTQVYFISAHFATIPTSTSDQMIG